MVGPDIRRHLAVVEKEAHSFASLMGNTLVDEHPVPQNFELVADMIAIKEWAKVIKCDPWSAKVPVPLGVVLSINYDLIFSNEHRKTQVVVKLERTNHPDGRGAFGPGWGDVPAAEIKMHFEIGGGLIAD